MFLHFETKYIWGTGVLHTRWLMRRPVKGCWWTTWWKSEKILWILRPHHQKLRPSKPDTATSMTYYMIFFGHSAPGGFRRNKKVRGKSLKHYKTTNGPKAHSPNVSSCVIFPSFESDTDSSSTFFPLQVTKTILNCIWNVFHKVFAKSEKERLPKWPFFFEAFPKASWNVTRTATQDFFFPQLAVVWARLAHVCDSENARRAKGGELVCSNWKSAHLKACKTKKNHTSVRTAADKNSPSGFPLHMWAFWHWTSVLRWVIKKPMWRTFSMEVLLYCYCMCCLSIAITLLDAAGDQKKYSGQEFALTGLSTKTRVLSPSNSLQTLKELREENNHAQLPRALKPLIEQTTQAWPQPIHATASVSSKYFWVHSHLLLITSFSSKIIVIEFCFNHFFS